MKFITPDHSSFMEWAHNNPMLALALLLLAASYLLSKHI